jgi:hypothetical protein
MMTVGEACFDVTVSQKSRCSFEVRSENAGQLSN